MIRNWWLLLIFVAVMDIGHVSMLVLGAGMFMFVRMRRVNMTMRMKLIMTMPMFMDNGHMDMKMGVLFICQ